MTCCVTAFVGAVETVVVIRRVARYRVKRSVASECLQAHSLNPYPARERRSRSVLLCLGRRLIVNLNPSHFGIGIAPYKTLTVQYYNEKIPLSGIAELIETDGNIAKYRFKKSETTAAKVIEDLSLKASIQDISVEEVGIEEIIRIAYG